MPILLGSIIVFSTLARGAHDLWAAGIVYAMTAIGFSVLLLRGRLNLSFIPFLICLLAFFGVSFSHSVNPGESLLGLLDWGAAGLIFLLAAHAFQDDAELTSFLKIIVPVFWVELVTTLIQYKTAHPGMIEKWGTLVNANILVSFLLLFLPVLICNFIQSRKLKDGLSWYWLSGLVAGLGAFATALSLWGWLCLLAGLPFLFGLDPLKKIYKRAPRFWWTAAIFAFGLVVFVIYKKLTHVYQWNVAELPARSSWSRLSWWGSGWGMFRDHIWFGVGIGNYPSAFLAYKVGTGQNTLYAHSFAVGLLAETGIMGIIGLLGFLSFWFFKVISNWERVKSRRPFFLGILMLLFFGSINLSIEYLAVLLVLFIFLGITAAPALQSAWPVRKSIALVFGLCCLTGLIFLLSIFMGSQNLVYGREKLQEGKIEEALTAFSSAAELDPLSFEAREGQARALFFRYKAGGDKKVLAEAIRSQRGAIELNRLSGLLWEELGIFLREAGQKQESSEALKIADRLSGRGG